MWERLAKKPLDEKRLQHEIEAALIVLMLLWMGNSKWVLLGVVFKKPSIGNKEPAYLLMFVQ